MKAAKKFDFQLISSINFFFLSVNIVHLARSYVVVLVVIVQESDYSLSIYYYRKQASNSGLPLVAGIPKMKQCAQLLLKKCVWRKLATFK